MTPRSSSRRSWACWSAHAWVGTVTFIAFRVIDVFSKHRVPPSSELGGLDVPEMGIEGYAVEIGGPE